MKKHKHQSDAQRIATKHNFWIFRLRGMKASLKNLANDADIKMRHRYVEEAIHYLDEVLFGLEALNELRKEGS